MLFILDKKCRTFLQAHDEMCVKLNDLFLNYCMEVNTSEYLSNEVDSVDHIESLLLRECSSFWSTLI